LRLLKTPAEAGVFSGFQIKSGMTGSDYLACHSPICKAKKSWTGKI